MHGHKRKGKTPTVIDHVLTLFILFWYVLVSQRITQPTLKLLYVNSIASAGQRRK